MKKNKDTWKIVTSKQEIKKQKSYSGWLRASIISITCQHHKSGPVIYRINQGNLSYILKKTLPNHTQE